MANEQQQLVEAIGTHLQQTFGDRSMASMRKLFERYDVDGDGKISKRELTQLLKDVEIGNSFTRGAWVNGIIDKVDLNADRAISWEEFQLVAGTPDA